MNAVKSIKSKIVAIVAVLVLAIAVMPAQAQFGDEPPHEYPDAPILAGCFDVKVFNICAYVNPDSRIGYIAVEAFGVTETYTLSSSQLSRDIHTEIFGYVIDMTARVNWRNQFFRLEGEVEQPNGAVKTFIRNLSWDSGNQGY